MKAVRVWRWAEVEGDAEARADALGRRFDLPRSVARVLVTRGLEAPETVDRLLHPHPDQLEDPWRMADMPAAADRLAAALRDGGRIVVNGDYDTDGVTGTALLVSELRRLGAQVDFFIPDRERDGYGITPRLVERAGAVGVEVLVSVDCGSSDHATIQRARELGIDVIVVDHHEIPERPQDACAVLNPKRDDCAYPFKGLSAVGVAYKLLQALSQRVQGAGQPQDGLDLVALGTLADVQPMVGENRVLTSLGLRRLGETDRPGIAALREVAGVASAARLRSGHVGWRLVPRLNAVGRVARGKLAVDLLLAPTPPHAARYARAVEQENARRKQLSLRATEEALEAAAQALERAEVAALVLASETWHPGVVGIAAARVSERFGRPAALIGLRHGQGRGSVRSAGGVDVRAALDAARSHLVKFGGHREAAGFTIEQEHLGAFREAFEAAVRAQAGRVGRAPLQVDADLDPEDLGPSLLEALDRLEPFGPDHPEPRFRVRGRAAGRTRRVGAGHLKLDLRLPGDRHLDAIAFGRGDGVDPAALLGRDLELVGAIRHQDPRFGDACQLVVDDLREAEVPADSAEAASG